MGEGLDLCDLALTVTSVVTVFQTLAAKCVFRENTNSPPSGDVRVGSSCVTSKPEGPGKARAWGAACGS